MNNRGHWRLGALASAIALMGSMASLDAHALALGRITVQSALGEALRAEVDISDLNAEEAASLKVGLATAEVFRSAGLEYPSSALGLDIKLQRRTDGRSYLRLSSNRAMTEPFVDLILEAKWASGRITRDYTMLFDPPNLRANTPTMAAPTAPVLSSPPLAVAREAATDPYSASVRPPATRPVAKAATVRTPPAERSTEAGRQVTVRPGDNASRIAAQNKPASVSLDQMLVAMLRSNPNAFIGGNINVIKSGAVLTIPDAQAANALSPAEATKTLMAESRDFNAFRRNLAEGVPVTAVGGPDRQAGGKIQARVEDRAQANVTPDKLTLSKGAVQGKSTAAIEDRAAREQEAKDASSRVAELSRNNSDLNKLGAVLASKANTAAADGSQAAPALAAEKSASSAATGVGITAAPTAAPASDSLGSSVPIASEAASPAASAPVLAGSEAAKPAVAAAKPAAVKAPPVVETGLMQQLQENSLLLLGAGGLLALLAGLGIARHRKNKKSSQIDSSFLDSRLQPDSFFGASGGRRIDTSETNADRSSLAYSPSQLDAGGDVDPVAEADVYLAYGRDQQAEEILTEALRTYPARIAIHTKLLEIYAKRRDVKAFDSIAEAAAKVTQKRGAEWAFIAELGREFNPANAVFDAEPEAEPSIFSADTQHADFAPAIPTTPMNLSTVAPTIAPTVAPAPASSVDLELDFSLDDLPEAPPEPSVIAAPPPFLAARTAASNPPVPAMNFDDLDLNLDLDLDLDIAPAIADPMSLNNFSASPSKKPMPTMDFLSSGLDFNPEPFMPAKAPAAPPAPVTHTGMMEFDLDSLSMDLSPTTQAPAFSLTQPEEDPLEVKFLLAEEFRLLGDADGARSLADEVMAKAKGPLKMKAQAFLNALS